MSEINCPECGKKMHKAGHIWSGRQKIQRYRCQNCGRTTSLTNIKTEEHTNETTDQS